VLLWAAVAQAAVAFINFGLPSVGPALRDVYGMSLPAYGAAVTATLLGAGASLIAWGFLVDRFGSRLSVLIGTAIAVVSVVAAAATSSPAILIAALFCSGLGTSVIPIAGAGALFKVYGAERRAWALGVRQMAVPLGGTAAAIALPGLEHAVDVHAVLYLTAALIGFTGVAFSFVANAGDAPGSRLVGFALLRILRVRRMWTLFAISVPYIIALQSSLSYLVPTTRDAGLTALGASIAYVVLNISAALCRIFWGKVADRGGGRRRGRTLVEVGLVTAVGAFAFAGSLHGGGLATILPAVALLGFGAFGWNHLIYVSAGESVPPEIAGQAVAVAATIVFGVSGILSAPVGALAAAHGWDPVWLLMGACGLVGAVLARRLQEQPARTL
jgi:MFS family permease